MNITRQKLLVSIILVIAFIFPYALPVSAQPLADYGLDTWYSTCSGNAQRSITINVPISLTKGQKYKMYVETEWPSREKDRLATSGYYKIYVYATSLVKVSYYDQTLLYDYVKVGAKKNGSYTTSLSLNFKATGSGSMMLGIDNSNAGTSSQSEVCFRYKVKKY